MAGDQAQQFAGHIAGTAEHHGGDRAPGFPALAHQSPPAAACARLAGDADGFDHVIAERGGIRQRVERGDFHLLLDDLDADLVVGGRTGDHARLDLEALTQQFPAEEHVLRTGRNR